MTDHITKLREALEAFDQASEACAGKHGPWLTTALMHKSRAYQSLSHTATASARSLLAALDEAQKDAKRLDWLNIGATVELVPVGQNVLAFRINGQNRTISMSIRAAIDEAIAAQEGSQDA